MEILIVIVVVTASVALWLLCQRQAAILTELHQATRELSGVAKASAASIEQIVGHASELVRNVDELVDMSRGICLGQQRQGEMAMPYRLEALAYVRHQCVVFLGRLLSADSINGDVRGRVVEEDSALFLYYRRYMMLMLDANSRAANGLERIDEAQARAEEAKGPSPVPTVSGDVDPLSMRLSDAQGIKDAIERLLKFGTTFDDVPVPQGISPEVRNRVRSLLAPSMTCH